MIDNANIPKDTCDPTHQDTPGDSNVLTIYPATDPSEGVPIGIEGPIMQFVVPKKTEKTADRWSHIPDLDNFFRRVYSYHQNHGFTVMAVEKSLQLLHIPFIFGVLFILRNGIDYTALFRNDVKYYNRKVLLSEVFLSPDECLNNTQGFDKFCMTIITIFWLLLSLHRAYDLLQYWNIKQFYNIALKIQDHELHHLTWYEIQERLLIVQAEVGMCITKRELTQLDVYHRILRFENYMVAMINKDVFPVKFKFPLVGEVLHFSGNYLFNIEILLFKSHWAPFISNMHVAEDYKNPDKKEELVNRLKKQILWLGTINLILSPFIFMWHMLYIAFKYAELIKRDPSTLGIRCWSKYACLYFRHFNELDHEFKARLSGAYKPSVLYMKSFSSQLMTVIAKNVTMFAGYVLTVMVVLTVYDEDVVTVQHVLTILTVLGLVVVAFRCYFRSYVPDENAVWHLEQRLKRVKSHLQYIPSAWQNLAHTSDVRNEFGQLFQNKLVYLIHEMISPVVTPIILLTSFRRRAPQIVEFFNNFTVTVMGVGDVCSFAQMNIPKHGDYNWRPSSPPSSPNTQHDENTMSEVSSVQNREMRSELGKTELSLINFTSRNTAWPMPSSSQRFLEEINKDVLEKAREAAMTAGVYIDRYAHSAITVSSPNNDPWNTAPNRSNTGDHDFGMFTVNGSIRSDASLNNYLRGQPKFEERITDGIGLSLMGGRSLGASVFGEGASFQSHGDAVQSGNVLDMQTTRLDLHEGHQNLKLLQENSVVSENHQGLTQRSHWEGSNLPTSHLSRGAPSTSNKPSERDPNSSGGSEAALLN